MSRRLRSAACGRADLLHALSEVTIPEHRVSTADALGFAPQTSLVPDPIPTSQHGALDSEVPRRPVSGLVSEQTAAKEERPIPVPLLQTVVIEHREEPDGEPEDDSIAPISWGEYTGPFAPTRLPSTPQLVTWSRLWPRLEAVLSGRAERSAVDVTRLVRAMVRGGGTPKQVPRKLRRHLPSRVVMLVDRSHRLAPFFEDQDEFRGRLRKLLGNAAVSSCVTRDGGVILQAGKPAPDAPSHVPVLALTDLGAYGNAEAQRQWLRRYRSHRRRGTRFAALCPMPTQAALWPRFASKWAMGWDPGARPHQSSIASGLGRTEALHRLLVALSFCLRVEHGLFRSVRRSLLVGYPLDVGAEAEVWGHPDVHAVHTEAFAVDAKLRQELPQLVATAPKFFSMVATCVRDWHRPLPSAVWMSELLVLEGLLGEQLPSEMVYDQRVATRRWRAVAVAMAGQSFEEHAVAAHWFRQLDPGLPSASYRGSAGRALLRIREASGCSGLPEDIDPVELGRQGRRNYYALWQSGRALKVMPRGEVTAGMLLGSFVSVSEHVRLRIDGVERVLNPGQLTTVDLGMRLREDEEIALLSDRTRLVARVIGRGEDNCRLGGSREGLWREQNLAGLIVREHWQPARQEAVGDGVEDGHWIDRSFPRRPSWAAECGYDQFGYWVMFEIEGVRQRMRYIPPGTFMMGSPESDEEAYSSEKPQHEVTLSRGYFMADTQCTQALWLAVMGDNPSRFKGDARPVEQVSWEDCQRFVATLNRRLPGLYARLPTEAEWEFACRAGTTTPRYGKLNEVAWHRGNSGDKTHRVAQKQPNTWGLQDMLGNVWEWCSDYWGAYVADPVIDPSGSARVIRGGSWGGGSWGSYARNVRAAGRSGRTPGLRLNYLGFRIARGPSW